MLPPILPSILLGSHITIVWAIVLVTQLGGILGHSAFMIPFISNKSVLAEQSCFDDVPAPESVKIIPTDSQRCVCVPCDKIYDVDTVFEFVVS